MSGIEKLSCQFGVRGDSYSCGSLGVILSVGSSPFNSKLVQVLGLGLVRCISEKMLSDPFNRNALNR